MQRVILITGAASGMGAATARRFAAADWRVACFDVDQARLAELERELGDGHLFGALDVSDRQTFETAVARVGAWSGGRLDLLFNNAGIAPQAMFDEMSWETVERILHVNLFGVMIGIRASLPLLRATPNALCFTTCSASAIFGSAGLAVYSASKHAVRGLTEALSVEFARFGIRVGDILPGYIETGMIPEVDRSNFATEGMWRLTPASAVAEVIWEAYYDPVERLHRYIPEDLAELERLVAEHPDAVRDDGRKRFSR